MSLSCAQIIQQTVRVSHGSTKKSRCRVLATPASKHSSQSHNDAAREDMRTSVDEKQYIQHDRRQMLMLSVASGAMLMASALPAEAKLVDKTIKGSSLSAFQKRDLLADFQKRVEAEMGKVLTAEDAPAAMRLLIHDAATYDAVNRTGGVNGSIALSSEELNRPVNKELKSLVEKLGKVRETVKAQGPPSQAMLSWADTIVLAAKVSTELSWNKVKGSKLSENNKKLSEQFGNPFEVTLGRLDATGADRDVSIPSPGSSPSEVQAFMSTLNVQDPSQLGGPFGKKAPFWERPTFLLWTASESDPEAAEAVFGADAAYELWKVKYDKSRATTFRQDYEIDFVTFFNKLADVGAKYDKGMYLYDLVIKVPDRF